MNINLLQFQNDSMHITRNNVSSTVKVFPTTQRSQATWKLSNLEKHEVPLTMADNGCQLSLSLSVSLNMHVTTTPSRYNDMLAARDVSPNGTNQLIE